MAAPDVTSPTTRRAVWRPDRWVRATAYAVAILPFVVAVVRALHERWYPVGDAAQLYIRSTDVLTRHHPWIGSGSSASIALGFQVNNAGPLYFDLIAPFARTLPPGWGASIGVAAVNVSCLVLAALAARRIGGAAHGAVFEGWVLAAGTVLGWSMGSQVLFDMFQAHALLFPFLAACVLLTGLALGQRWVLPWLALVVTLILQTHLSYAFILPLLSVAAAATALARLGAPRWERLRAIATTRATRRTVAWTAVVLVAAWVQPLLEQLFGPGEGNLSRLARAARTSDLALGLPNAVKLTGAFVALPPWASRQGFADTIQPSGVVTAADGTRSVHLVGMPAGWVAVVGLVVVVLVLGAVWWYAGRRGNPVLRVLAVLSATGVVASVIALSRLTVTPLGFAPHHTRWIFVVALVTYLTVAWALADVVVRRSPGVRPTLVTLVIVMAVAAANLPRSAQPHGPIAGEHAIPALRAVFDGIDEARRSGRLAEPVYFDLSNERIYSPHTSALQLRFRERDVEFRFDSEFLERQLGVGRAADGSEPTTLSLLYEWDAYRPTEGCVVVRETGQSPADKALDEMRATEFVDAVRRAFDDGALTIAVPDDAGEPDVSIAAAVVAGDATTLAEISLDGRLRHWLDTGWAVADGPVAERISVEGPPLTAWLRTWFGVALSGPGACR